MTYKRWDSRYTVKVLEGMKVPYKIIVDKPDYENYAKVIDKENILILPKRYRTNYDTYWHDKKGKEGSGPARNFAWEHSIKSGAKYHWVIDDNIRAFMRLHNNQKYIVNNGGIFRAAEDFVERYDNIAISGFNYEWFCPKGQKFPPYVANTKVYSTILIKNDIPFRWRGRYNEDVDFSLRILKAGYATVQFNAFLSRKARTQTVKGGNQAEFYGKEGTYNKSKMLYEMHPDVVEMVWKFGRCHHYVNYKPFKNNKMIRKKNLKLKNKSNEYGMKIKN